MVITFMKDKSSLFGLGINEVRIACGHLPSHSHIVRFLNSLNFKNKVINQLIIHVDLGDFDKTFQANQNC